MNHSSRDPAVTDERGDDRLLTVDEVAKLLNLPRSWVYAASAAGRIPSLKLGKYVRIDPVALRAWLAEQRVEAGGRLP